MTFPETRFGSVLTSRRVECGKYGVRHMGNVGLVVLSICLLLGSRAFADEPPLEEPSAEEDTGDTVGESDSDEKYNEKTALLASLIPTVSGVAVGSVLTGVGFGIENYDIALAGIFTLVGSIAIGPSIGQFYANNIPRGLLHLVVSPLTSLTALFALFVASESLLSSNPELWYIASAMLATTVLAYAAHTIFTAPHSARKANKEYRNRLRRVALIPAVFASSDKHPHLGLQITGAF